MRVRSHREGEALRLIHEAPHEQRRERPGADDAKHGGAKERSAEVASHHADELAQSGLVAVFAVAGEDRHEGLRERAFGEQAPEEVGNAKGEEERVGDSRRAEHMREHDVAHQAGDARQHGHAADHHALGGDVRRGPGVRRVRHLQPKPLAARDGSISAKPRDRRPNGGIGSARFVMVRSPSIKVRLSVLAVAAHGH